AAEFDGDLAQAFARSDNRFLVIAFSSDWRFSAERSREITQALYANNLDVTFAEIEAPQGHDAFLLKIAPYHDMVRAYMDRLAEEAGL
ncbi:MAG TPA: homoserine O-acetyltransferase, partial [Gammaproteobacteria bacterium]|nr:homoserine O-acetyltransferase [Gammaproteobacteria bacterium]